MGWSIGGKVGRGEVQGEAMSSGSCTSSDGSCEVACKVEAVFSQGDGGASSFINPRKVFASTPRACYLLTEAPVLSAVQWHALMRLRLAAAKCDLYPDCPVCSSCNCCSSSCDTMRLNARVLSLSATWRSCPQSRPGSGEAEEGLVATMYMGPLGV